MFWKVRPMPSWATLCGEEPVMSLPEKLNLEDEAPVGFWTDLAAEVRKELKPPVAGFFVSANNAPVKGVLKGAHLVLICQNSFTMECVNKPEILSLIARKASAKLNARVQVMAMDQTSGTVKNEQMEQLLQFGRAHSDIIKISDN